MSIAWAFTPQFLLIIKKSKQIEFICKFLLIYPLNKPCYFARNPPLHR